MGYDLAKAYYEMKQKAKQSEVMVQEICQDIKKLDFAKKHIITINTIVHRLVMRFRFKSFGSPFVQSLKITLLKVLREWKVVMSLYTTVLDKIIIGNLQDISKHQSCSYPKLMYECMSFDKRRRIWVAWTLCKLDTNLFNGGWTCIQCQLWNSYKPWLQNTSTNKQLDSLKSSGFNLHLFHIGVEPMGCAH